MWGWEAVFCCCSGSSSSSSSSSPLLLVFLCASLFRRLVVRQVVSCGEGEGGDISLPFSFKEDFLSLWSELEVFFFLGPTQKKTINF